MIEIESKNITYNKYLKKGQIKYIKTLFLRYFKFVKINEQVIFNTKKYN